MFPHYTVKFVQFNKSYKYQSVYSVPFKTCGRSAFELCLIRKQEKPGFYDK